jgi:hypothetical protein
VAAVEREQLVQVDVGHPVAPGHHERLVAQVRREALDAAAGGGLEAGVDQLDGPVLVLGAGMADDLPSFELRVRLPL